MTAPQWFPVDAELWQTPRSKRTKLTWFTRRVAIYLRYRADRKEETVLASVPRIAADTQLSENKVKLSLKELSRWPSRRRRFILKHHKSDNKIILRPAPTPFVRCHRWLWESALPEDLKDILLFIRSRFTGKAEDGTELFDCNRFGQKQPSILHCCYVKGTDFQARRGRLQKIIKLLSRSGLMVVKARSTRQKTMVVALCDESPSRTVSKILIGQRSAYKTSRQVHSKSSSSAYTPESVSKSPSSKSAVVLRTPPPSKEAGPGVPLDEAENLARYLNDKSKLSELLAACANKLGLSRGRINYYQAAYNLQKLWSRLTSAEQEELLVADLLTALNSDVWDGMDKALGLRVSLKFQHRLKIELLIPLEARLEEIEKERQEEERATPEWNWNRAIHQKYEQIGPWNKSVKLSEMLPYIILYAFPHLRNNFTADRTYPGELCCPEPVRFLTEEEISRVFPVWERVFNSDDVPRAVAALNKAEPGPAESKESRNDPAMDALLAELDEEMKR